MKKSKHIIVFCALIVSFLGAQQAYANYCNWYSQIVPLCENQQFNWGWENNMTCIGAQTCESQTGGGGIIEVGPTPDLQEIYALIEQQQAAIEQLQATVATLSSENAELKSDMAFVKENTVEGLADYIVVGDDNNGYPAVQVVDANLKVYTPSLDEGVGNVIIGFNSASSTIEPHCSRLVHFGTFLLTQEDCEANGYVWADVHKTGHHNLVIGTSHNYSDRHSIVAGWNNVSAGGGSIAVGEDNITGSISSVTGTTGSVAYRQGAVLGGYQNKANKYATTVIGGGKNVADATYSVVVGGEETVAEGLNYSVVIGGSN